MEEYLYVYLSMDKSYLFFIPGAVIQSYDVSLESYLVHLSDFNFVNTLLGATIPYFENNAKEHLKFLKECATYWNIPKPSLVHYVSKPHLNA